MVIRLRYEFDISTPIKVFERDFEWPDGLSTSRILVSNLSDSRDIITFICYDVSKEGGREIYTIVELHGKLQTPEDVLKYGFEEVVRSPAA